MLVVSCNAWLDVTPENAIADDDLFSTGFGYRNALNGIYTNLASDELYGKQLSWGFLSAISQQYNQKAGTISPMYADASELIYNTVDTEPVVTAIWEKGYKVIANLNKLIENIRPTDISLFEYGEEEKNLIYAEALSLRAMMHFDLLRLFAPATATNPSGSYLPYRDKYEAAVVEKCTVTDFIEKVLKDLLEAEDILRKFDTEYHPGSDVRFTNVRTYSRMECPLPLQLRFLYRRYGSILLVSWHPLQLSGIAGVESPCLHLCRSCLLQECRDSRQRTLQHLLSAETVDRLYRRREHYLQSQFPIYKSLPRHIVRLVQETAGYGL